MRPNRILAGAILLLAVAGCGAPPPGGRFSTNALPSGATEKAETHRLPNGDLELVVAFKNTPERYSIDDVDYADDLLLGEIAPARSACAPLMAQRLDSRYDARRVARISHWRCV